MQGTTASDETSQALEDAVQKLYSEGDVVPVTMEGVVVGTATVLAGGQLSVTLNDNPFASRIEIPAGGFSLAFTDDPNG